MRQNQSQKFLRKRRQVSRVMRSAKVRHCDEWLAKTQIVVECWCWNHEADSFLILTSLDTCNYQAPSVGDYPPLAAISSQCRRPNQQTCGLRLTVRARCNSTWYPCQSICMISFQRDNFPRALSRLPQGLSGYDTCKQCLQFSASFLPKTQLARCCGGGFQTAGWPPIPAGEPFGNRRLPELRPNQQWKDDT